jgi:hypothetical protein
MKSHLSNILEYIPDKNSRYNMIGYLNQKISIVNPIKFPAIAKICHVIFMQIINKSECTTAHKEEIHYIRTNFF